MAIISPYSSSSSSYVTAGQQVAGPPQQYPSCLRRLIGLGWLLALVACALLVERIWTRRGRQPASIFARHARPLGNGVAMQHYHGRERVTQTVLNSNKVGLLRLDRWT